MAIAYIEVVQNKPVAVRIYCAKYGIWERAELPPGTPEQQVRALYDFARVRGVYWVKETHTLSGGQHISSASISLPDWARRHGAFKEA